MRKAARAAGGKWGERKREGSGGAASPGRGRGSSDQAGTADAAGGGALGTRVDSDPVEFVYKGFGIKR